MRIVGPLRRSDEGAYAVLYAMLLVVFIGVVSIVVDLGMLRLDRRANRAAADAAAAAGSAALGRAGTDPARACEQAMRYAEIALGADPGSNNCTDPAIFGGPIVCTPETEPRTATESVSGRVIRVTWPVTDTNPLLTSPSWESGGGAGNPASQPNAELIDGEPCQRIAVEIAHQRQLAFAAIWNWSEVTTSTHSVGLADEGGRGSAIVPLVALREDNCGLTVSGATLTIEPTEDGLHPGEISVDSNGDGCGAGTAITLPSGGQIFVDGTPSGVPGHIYTREADPSYPDCTQICPHPERRVDAVGDKPWVDRYNCDDSAPEGCDNKGLNGATLPGPHDYVDQLTDFVPALPVPPPPIPCVIEDVQVLGNTFCGTGLSITETGELLVNGDLTVLGNAIVEGRLEVTGKLYTQPTSAIDGRLEVRGGTATIRDLLIVGDPDSSAGSGPDLQVEGGGTVSAPGGMLIDDGVLVGFETNSGCVIVSERYGDCSAWTTAGTPDADDDIDISVRVGGELRTRGSGSVIFDQTFTRVGQLLEVDSPSGRIVLVAPYQEQAACVPATSPLSGPSSACFEDMTLWAAGNHTGSTHTLDAADTYIDGTIFDPRKLLRLRGGFPTALRAQIVASQVSILDDLTLVPDAQRSTPVPRSGGSLIR